MGDSVLGPVAPRWLTMQQACGYASMTRKTMRRMLEEGHFTGRRMPGRARADGHWRIDRESIDAYFGETEDLARMVVGSLGR